MYYAPMSTPSILRRKWQFTDNTTQKETSMTKIYVIVSAVILFALLMLGPLFSMNSSAKNVAVSWNTAPSLIDGWTAGPGSYD